MQKTAISIFFSCIFTLLIVAPTLISMVEDSFDISIIIDMGEEESKEKETKKLEIELTMSKFSDLELMASEERSRAEHYSRSYSSFYLKLHSPPPEQV